MPNINKKELIANLFHISLAIGDAKFELDGMENVQMVNECLDIASEYLEYIVQQLGGWDENENN